MLAAQIADPLWVDLDIAVTHDVLGAWIVCLLTLAVYSFLYRDNPFYKAAEHLFVGVATAWFTMEFYKSGILDALYEPLVHGFALVAGPEQATIPIGGYLVPAGLAVGLRLVAVALSFMLLVRLVDRGSWAPRWPLAMMVGIYAALKMTSETQARFVKQIQETMVPIAPPGADWLVVTGNVVFVVGLICVLGHFLFTFRRSKPLAAVSRVGIVTLMLTFGSMFGFTVLGRIALLIERVDTLDLYTAPAYSLAGAQPGWLDTALTPPFLVGALIVAVLALMAMTRRAPPA